MDMDLGDFLKAWPYDPEHTARNYRIIHGIDGRKILQAREPFGIQQMEYDGRPDGLRPHGKTTWLEHYEALARESFDFELDSDACQILMSEGILFYQRYLMLFQMEDWDGVVRDTGRNLRYFDFLKNHATDRNDYLIVAQYLPYVMRMNAIARARLLWEAACPEEAISILKETLLAIKRLEPTPTAVFKIESERSIKSLEELIETFETIKPENRLEALQRLQREAIEREDFEAAARLRDEIRQLRELAGLS